MAKTTSKSAAKKKTTGQMRDLKPKTAKSRAIRGGLSKPRMFT
jgi:hypothetical protein